MHRFTAAYRAQSPFFLRPLHHHYHYDYYYYIFYQHCLRYWYYYLCDSHPEGLPGPSFPELSGPALPSRCGKSAGLYDEPDRRRAPAGGVDLKFRVAWGLGL